MVAAVGTTSGIGEIVPIVLYLVTWTTPGNYSRCMLVTIGLAITNFLSRRHPSWFSSGPHQRVQTSRNTAVWPLGPLMALPKGYGHDRLICENESLLKVHTSAGYSVQIHGKNVMCNCQCTLAEGATWDWVQTHWWRLKICVWILRKMN